MNDKDKIVRIVGGNENHENEIMDAPKNQEKYQYISSFVFSLKSPAPPLGYLGHSAHIPRSSSICFIYNMYRYSIQILDGPVWSGLDN